MTHRWLSGAQAVLPLAFVLALATAAMNPEPAGAQPPSSSAEAPPPYQFTAADWPGTAEQAAALDAEPRDPEWATAMEQLLTEGLDGLEDVDFLGRRIVCRTTLCGIAFEYSIADPRSVRFTQTRQIREMFVGAVKESTERIGTDGLSFDFSAAYGLDGNWTGKVGITVKRRTPTDDELLLFLPEGAGEPE